MILVDSIKQYSIKKSLVILGTFLFGLTACSSDEPDTKTKPEPNPDPVGYISINGETQGTTYSIVYDQVNVVTKEQIDSVLLDFDNSLSTYNPASLVSHFNGYGETETDFYLEQVYRISKKMYTLTDGSFDPAIYPVIELIGFGQTEQDTVIWSEVDSVLQYCHFSDIEFDSVGHTLVANNNNQLEFNAIAQGYSVDVIADFLMSKGIKNYLVEIGGEIRVSGVNSEGFMWRLGIEEPNEMKTGALKQIINLTDRALATSGSYRKFKVIDGKRYSHTIDPKSGRPVTHSLLSASVVANTAAEADALATAFMVMGIEKTQEFVNEHPELNLDVFLIYDEDGTYKTWQSSAFEELTDQAA